MANYRGTAELALDVARYGDDVVLEDAGREVIVSKKPRMTRWASITDGLDKAAAQTVIANLERMFADEVDEAYQNGEQK